VKYDSDVALDYRDKLTADIEGKVWVPVVRPPRVPRCSTPLQPSSTPISRASSTSSFQQPQSSQQKSRNESYFAGLGNANSQRPDGVPPSQGGRYSGFGSTPPVPTQSTQDETLSMDDFTTDPLGTLTKGWSMFSRAAVKTASMVNEQYVQPSVAKVTIPSFGAYSSYKILISKNRLRGISLALRIQFRKLDLQGTKPWGNKSLHIRVSSFLVPLCLEVPLVVLVFRGRKMIMMIFGLRMGLKMRRGQRESRTLILLDNPIVPLVRIQRLLRKMMSGRIGERHVTVS
jgi:hypothetical protein